MFIVVFLSGFSMIFYMKNCRYLLVNMAYIATSCCFSESGCSLLYLVDNQWSDSIISYHLFRIHLNAFLLMLIKLSVGLFNIYNIYINGLYCACGKLTSIKLCKKSHTYLGYN